jgi:alkanesulfonate monooxygenase SsuD/methylene tetrahydromethanopterin reductase-like flavin-dependent oxidoreductase (luciferase family)
MPPFDSAFVMATLVAARTRRIRIGTAVSLAAFYHSLRLAEEVVPAKAEEVARRGARWLVDS